jgi:hypothetical protein
MLSNLFEVYKGLELGNSDHRTRINHPRVPPNTMPKVRFLRLLQNIQCALRCR